MYQKITIHTLLSSVIGFAVPLFIYFTYTFWLEKTQEFTRLFYFDFYIDVQLYLKIKLQVFLWLLFILVSFSLIAKTGKLLNINTTFKKSWIMLVFHFFIALFFVIFIKNKNSSELLFLLIPCSIIIANGVELINQKRVKNILFYSLIIGTIIFSFFL